MECEILHRIAIVNWMRGAFRNMKSEDWAVALFGASFLIGVWYALPMVNTITDVWAFGGGVLRAMEADSLLPGYGVSYGTVSFYQNYVAMAVALALALPLYGFDIAALKSALVLNPSYSLLVPRIVSALTAALVLAVVYRFLKVHVHSAWWRLALLMLVFGNVLTALLTRSGKMWMLSIGLGVVSFIYLYRALTEEKEAGVPGKLAATSVVTAFLAAANFSFAGLFLVNIPILFFAFPRTLGSLRRLAYSVAGGTGLFLLFFALNAKNTVIQLSEFIVPLLNPAVGMISEGFARLTFFESLMVNSRQAIEAFPLILLALVFALWGGMRDRLLAYLSLAYLSIYILAVAFIFRTDHGLSLNVRHIFPLGFFLLFFITAYKPPARRVAVAFFAAGLLVYLYALFLLSVPTTYNAAADFIVARYSEASIRVDEHIFELTLPTNKASYALFASSSCGSACTHMRAMERDIAFQPIVITSDSDPILVADLAPPDVIVVEREIADCMPLARFGSGVADDEVFDIDINLGRMLMPSFYHLKRLGKNIYVYDGKDCAYPNGPR